MRATIQEVFDAYVDELTRYREWTDERKAVYGKDSSPMESWDNSDYERINRWNHALNVVRDVLGLTRAEDAEADRRAGISC